MLFTHVNRLQGIDVNVGGRVKVMRINEEICKNVDDNYKCAYAYIVYNEKMKERVT